MNFPIHHSRTVKPAMTLAFNLTDRTIGSAKRTDKAKQLTDGRGLYLKLLWNRARHSWRFDFKSPTTGRRLTLTLGDYPTVTLKVAREKAEDARRLIDKGVCPAEARDAAKKALDVAAVHAKRKAEGLPALGTFQAVALDFAARKYTEGAKVNAWSADHSAKWKRILRLHAFPTIGDKHVKDLKPIDFLDVVQKLEKADKAETALCVRRFCLQVMDHATLLQLAGEANPVNVIKRHVQTGAIRKSFAAVTTPDAVGDLMTKIQAYPNAIVRGCLLMSAYTAQRPANVRGMEWAHLDLDAALWTIPSAAMKNSQELKRKGSPHKVPLPRQAVALLRLLKKDAEQGARFVFPNNIRELRNLRPLGKGAPVRALARMGITGDDMTAHGFRAMLRTLAPVALGVSPLVLEEQLAHAVGIEREDGTVVLDTLKGSYFRPDYFAERVAAMQAWADYLGTLSKGAAPLKLAA
jgi:integrase